MNTCGNECNSSVKKKIPPTFHNAEAGDIQTNDFVTPVLRFTTIMSVVKCHVLAAMSVKMTAFWDITPCGLIEADRCFGGAYCLYLQGDDGGKMNLRNVGLLQRGYTVLYPTELSSSTLLVVFCGCKMRCYFEGRTYSKCVLKQ
jgi:hypothetical protein